MRILSVAVGLVLLSGAAVAQSVPGDNAGKLSDVAVTKETALGPLKSVEGTVSGVKPIGQGRLQDITVWVNGYTTKPGLDSVWKILIPNEAVSKVVAFQPYFNVTIAHGARELGHVKKFKAMNPTVGAPNDVTQGGGDGGIRDLLNHPPPGATESDVTQGGGDGGIRDLLHKGGVPTDGEVTQGGGDGGIRDLLRNGKKAPADVTQGGGDGGIRDLLNTPPPQK